jgi:nucleoid DNA-binding protein
MMGPDPSTPLERDSAMPDKKGAKQSQKKMKAVKAKLSKAELVDLLSTDSDVCKGDVKRVLGSLERLMEASICRRGIGSFTLPSLMKITTLRRPAVKARKGINPFTGEETWFKAKPARMQVKIRPLKKLKGFAN